MKLTVCCFKWRSPKGYRAKYTGAHVKTLRNMFARHLHIPHEFVCITDDHGGIDSNIRIVPLWDDFSHVPSPHGQREPSCYRRLKLFKAEMREMIGERIVWCDLDMVLVNDVTPIFNRKEPVVLMPTDVANIPVNGSLVMLTPGACEEVWNDFNPDNSPVKTREAGCYGSDQGWLAYCLGKKAAFWKPGARGDGIYFFGQHMRRLGQGTRLPSDARLISFHGRSLPWDSECSQISWIREHYK